MGGKFITFEGGEGTGKSTQVARLAEAMRGGGREVVTTREPGGSPGADQIRSLLVEGEPGRWDAVAETLLVYAARRDHLHRTVRPALDRGAVVICDRFIDSTTAYQGFGRGLAGELIERIRQAAIGGFQPDLTLVLDLPVEAGLARAAARGGAETRFESFDVAFHQRVREGFLSIAAGEPRCVVINAEAAVETVAARILEVVRDRLSPL